MHPKDTLNRLDQLIQSRSILKHTFYVVWQQGELTRDQLATYATVYYPHVAAFPRYLESAIDSSSDPRVRAELERNLSDELADPAPHNELWLDFATGLGLERGTVAGAERRPAAEQIVSVFEKQMEISSAAALAALYAYESQQPEVAQQKIDGLRRFYGLADPASLAYFQVHAETDLEHREGERRALLRCLELGASPDEILDAATEALDAYWTLLDGVCVEAGIATPV
jgi:pyrroloquinoline-quinone synthase